MTKYNVTLTPMLRGEIFEAQSSDEGVAHIKRRLAKGDPKVNYFYMDGEGVLWFKDRLVVPKNHELCKKIFDEAHTSIFHSPQQHKDVLWSEGTILVDSNEARDYSLCHRMRHMLKSQGQSYDTYQIVATSEYSCLDMGRHQSGFHCGSAFLYPQV
jgi:hypothetical protein